MTMLLPFLFYLLRREKRAFDEAVSCFQKSIRESKVYPALYWAYEMTYDKSGTTAVFNKMRTECCEDIGLANPEAIVLIDDLLSQYQILHDDNCWKSGIIYLCNSDKNREVDWFLIGVKSIMIKKQGFKPTKYKTLQEAIDNKDEEEAFYYAYNIKKKKDLWTLLLSNRNDQVIQALMNSYNSICKSTRGGDLFWSMALLYIIRNYPSYKINTPTIMRRLIDNAMRFNLSVINVPIVPYYYIDKHTKRGKRWGRGINHWYINLHLYPLVKVQNEHWETIVKPNLNLLK